MNRQLSLFPLVPVTFDKVQEFLNSVPDINRGGCGISALAMMLWLKKNAPALAKTVRIYFGYYSKYARDTNTNLKMGKVKDGTPESPAHCWLHINGKNEDSSGKIVNDLLYKHTVSVKFLKDVINRARWNDTFDRREVPNIESALGLKLGLNGGD